jgi:hypothetical protein
VAERFRITRVRSYSSGTRGRALCQARDQHFVVDDYAYNGGPGEALGARESRMPLKWTDVTVEGTRDGEAPPIHESLSVYDAVHLHFDLTGLDDDQAQELVNTYKRR